MSKDQRLSGTIFLSKQMIQFPRLHRRTVDQYADVIVEIKNSIGGHFYISEINKDYVVIKATRSPFGEIVHDPPHLFMMTSSVFDGIAARKLGFGQFHFKKRIVMGERGCKVIIYFKPQHTEEGLVYDNLTMDPSNGNLSIREEETIQYLNDEMQKSDELILSLLDELENLKAEVDFLRSREGI